jgi:hypothetical protein
MCTTAGNHNSASDLGEEGQVEIYIDHGGNTAAILTDFHLVMFYPKNIM